MATKAAVYREQAARALRLAKHAPEDIAGRLRVLAADYLAEADREDATERTRIAP